jgi:2-polyprenyl-6-hydroxyphenyl methylase/3-demethylubiquinone-9 3-methyltransferase
MAEALDDRGAQVTGIDPAEDAIEAARTHAQSRTIAYDVGVGEALPYSDGQFDAVVCVDVLEHIADLSQVLAEVVRVLKPGGLFLFDTINRNPIARLATITVVEDILGLLPKGTHDPTMSIKPSELERGLVAAGLEVGQFTGLGPRGMNRHGDLTFGQLPLKVVIYMGSAVKLMV